ncbi:MAG: DUF2927 domain-containing protein [Pseudomonadota bacterium]
MRRLAVAVLLLVAACAQPSAPVLTNAKAPATPEVGSAIPAGETAWSNRSLARVFTELTHGLEWGPSRPALVRYEAPVRVRLSGPGSNQYGAFLDRYLSFLRQNAGVDIATALASANLHIRFVEGRRFAKKLPAISCVVAPGDLDWSDFSRDPDRLGGVALERAQQISDMTIFIPQNAAPYLIRSCLIEETAQALGPANDLYGLGPTIFNDDAAHIWPTALDVLMLRVLYQPEMRTGLSKRETEARALAILDRLNSAGQSAPAIGVPRDGALASWRDTHREIFSRATSQNSAPSYARRALDLAERRAPGSPYHCHSLQTLGRVLARRAPAEALGVLDRATTTCARVHGIGDIRLSLIALERAIALARQGSYTAVLQSLASHEKRLADNRQEERLAALYNLRAKAHGALGQTAKADAAAKLAVKWAAYAYGSGSSTVLRMTRSGASG